MNAPRFDTRDAAMTWARRTQPRQRRVPTEEQEQIALVAWIRTQEHAHPELSLLYHVPNGGWRHKRQAVQFTRMGVLPGIADLVLPCARRGAHSLYIELKALDGTLSEWQLKRAIDFAEQGNIVAFAWGWKEARDILLWYLEKT